MASFLPQSGQYLDPLGAALGGGLGQGLAGAGNLMAQQRDRQALNNYLMALRGPTMGPNELMSPALGNFGMTGGATQGMPPMPMFLSPQYQQLGMNLMGRQALNQLPLGPLEGAQLGKLQAETDYLRRRPAQTLSVSEQLHHYALSLGHPPGTQDYDRITKGAEAVKPTVQELLHNLAIKAGHQPGTPGYARFIKGEEEVSAADRLQLASGLRKEFDAAQTKKNFEIIQRQERGMQHALTMSKRPGASRVASDQALAVQFQKMLDPSSVVRESEYARTPEGVAMLSRLEGELQKLRQGGLAMTDADRESMVEMAQTLLLESKRSMNEHIGRYTELADLYGINKKLIFGNIKPFDVAGPPSGNVSITAPDGKVFYIPSDKVAETKRMWGLE
jgi:hypothetical protein